MVLKLLPFLCLLVLCHSQDLYKTTEKPESDSKSAACGLSYDRGPCHNFSMHWYFDTEFGGCTRFWYGGCQGNANKFATKEECEDSCVNPQPTVSSSASQGDKGNSNMNSACGLSYERGPCDNYTSLWYFDTEIRVCSRFWYGGCEGNANKFATKEECEDSCVNPQPTVSSSASQGDKGNSNMNSACGLSYDRGPCRNFTASWYFDTQYGGCSRFWYGGCDGNANRFANKEECENTCVSPPAKVTDLA